MIVPAVVVTVEAAWLSLWLAALAATGPGERSRLPFLALAIPGVLATAFTGLSARSRAHRAARLVVVAVIAAAGVTATAFALASLLHGSLGGWFGHPWRIAGHPTRGETILAWWVALLAWGRGVWIAWEEPTSKAVAASAAIDVAAFAVFFLAAGLDRHDRHFSTLAVQASLLLLLGIPAALAAVALARESELERWRLRQRTARPSLAWLAAVLAPMLLAGVVALLAGLAGGPLRPVVVTSARFVGRVLGALLRGIVRLLGFIHLRATAPPVRPVRGSPVLPPAGHVKVHTPPWLEAVAITILVLAALVVLLLVLRLLRMLIARLRLPVARDEDGAEEEADSLFSWSHLLEQLLAALARLFRPRRKPVAPAPASAGAWQGGELDAIPAEAASVRAHYRRVLRAARHAGLGRAPSETPLELGRRLAASEGGVPEEVIPARAALDELTTLYDLARYASEQAPAAGALLGEEHIARAGRCADELVEVLAPAVLDAPPG